MREPVYLASEHMVTPGVQTWVSDWGEFEIPADVPRAFRNDGWFDRRYKIQSHLRAYFNAMTDRLRDGKSILTWAEWTAN